ncbi:expansin-A15-like [Actinidia eriantha]|uniref:expansin-A15-like n=1 Tax=Actinidia eriantha TaxID=165200 RepID=UPI002588278B|nr:expansin-A15-like [Actinidia eriantha]
MPACRIQNLSLLPVTLVASTPPLLTTAHYYSAAFPSSSPNTLSEWRSARATYYAAADPRDACGYGDLVKAGYGMETAGLSARCSTWADYAARASRYGAWRTSGGVFRAPPLLLPPPIFVRRIRDSPPTEVATVTLRTITSYSPLKPSRSSPFGRPGTCLFSTAGLNAERKGEFDSELMVPEYSCQC